MIALGWFTIASLLGVACYAVMQWYRQLTDTREAQYGLVWLNRRI